MTMYPIATRLAVYVLLAAEDEGQNAHASEVLDTAQEIVSKLSAEEFQLYADEYDDSRVRWALSRAVTTLVAN
jgi:hypothetical protein